MFNATDRQTMLEKVKICENYYSEYGYLHYDSIEMVSDWVTDNSLGIRCLTAAEQDGWTGEYGNEGKKVRLSIKAPNGGLYVTQFVTV